MSDSAVHGFDQTNGVAEGLDGREVNIADFPGENAASASTLAGSGLHDGGTQVDQATEDAPDLDASAERRGRTDDDDEDDRAADTTGTAGDARVDDDTAPRDAAPVAAAGTDARSDGLPDTAPVDTADDAGTPAADGLDGDAPGGREGDDAFADVADAADPQGAPTDDEGVDPDDAPSGVLAEDTVVATDSAGDALVSDAVVTGDAPQDESGDADDRSGEHHHHRHEHHLPSADPLAGDPGHQFDQTNGVIDGFDGESDGTAASDAHSAGDRDL